MKPVSSLHRKSKSIQRTGEESRKIFKEEFEIVMKDSGMPYIEIMDYNVGIRALSVRMDSKRLGRYYFRYGVLVIYTYLTNEKKVIADIEFFKTNENGILKDYSTYGSIYINLIHKTIPTMFDKPWFKGIPYKILFVNTYAPFNDEVYDIVSQNTLLDDDYCLIPLRTGRGYTVIEFLECKWVMRYKYGKTYVVKQDLFTSTRNSLDRDQFNPTVTVFTNLVREMEEIRDIEEKKKIII